MKTCTIVGNLASEQTHDNFPKVQICDACFDADKKLNEDQSICTTESYDANLGDSCEYCRKTLSEELESVRV